MKLAILTCAAVACSVAHAKPECYEDPRTNAFTCWDDALVTERDGIRYSPIYMGGPKEIQRTGFEAAVNCSTGIMHMKDRQGVSFGGGHKSATPLAAAMVDGVCSAQVKAKKK